MDAWLTDLRYAARTTSRTPGFAAAIVATLALGIGATAAVFSVVNSVLLRPLQAPNPERVMQFAYASQQTVVGPYASVPWFRIWREQRALFEDVSAYRLQQLSVTSAAGPEQVSAAQVSSDFFRLFGLRTQTGRVFGAGEDQPNVPLVAVLSHGFWQRFFGGDPQVLGRSLSLSGDTYLVVGVADRTSPIDLFDEPPDVYVPFQLDLDSQDRVAFFFVAGRLRPDVSVAAANVQLAAAYAAYRDSFGGSDLDGFLVRPLQEAAIGDVRPSLMTLLAAVALVLLIACANVTSLLLSRATGRQRDFALHAALGASRLRLARLLLTESLILSGIAAIVGVTIGILGIRALLAAFPGNLPRVGVDASAITIDWRVLTFGVGVTVSTAILVAVVPGLRAARGDLALTLKEGGLHARSGGRSFSRSMLIVAEMALAVVLLVGATLLIRTSAAYRAVDTGFDPTNVLIAETSLAGTRFSRTSAVDAVVQEATRRLGALPGVEAAAAMCCVPLELGYALPFVVEGLPLNSFAHGGGGYTFVSPGYFAVHRIGVVRGRLFSDTDHAGAPGVVVINEALARRWPGGDPLNSRILIGRGVRSEYEDDPVRQVIGIVRDVRDVRLDTPPRPTMYVPLAQLPDGLTALNVTVQPLAWAVRAEVAPQRLAAAVEKELEDAGGVPVSRLRSLEEVVARSTARQTFFMWLMSLFSGSALALGGIGVYALMSYTLQQRTAEFAVRLALGAPWRTLRTMAIYGPMCLATIGAVIGLTVAWGASRVLASLLFGVTERDPVAFAVAPVLLLCVAFIGVSLPARRIRMIDPAHALRRE